VISPLHPEHGRRAEASANNPATHPLHPDHGQPDSIPPAKASYASTKTLSPQRTSRSQAHSMIRLKIMQQQVGHESDSSTAIYTHVSDDFMNTMLRRALAPAWDGEHRVERDGR
jgi:hypothetical protein